MYMYKIFGGPVGMVTAVALYPKSLRVYLLSSHLSPYPSPPSPLSLSSLPPIPLLPPPIPLLPPPIPLLPPPYPSPPSPLSLSSLPLSLSSLPPIPLLPPPIPLLPPPYPFPLPPIPLLPPPPSSGVTRMWTRTIVWSTTTPTTLMMPTVSQGMWSVTS